MTRHALSASEFAEYAREQIRTADALLARHGAASRVLCRCGRPVPCSQAEALRIRKAHYLARLGLAEVTVPLRVVTSAVPPQASGIRGLLYRLTRRDR